MRLFAPNGKSSLSTPVLIALLAGGFAGVNSWFCTYPLDYIKTVIQSQDLDSPKYKSTIECIITQYKK